MYKKYAYRLETRRIKESEFPYSGQTLDRPETVADFARPLENSDIEKFTVLYLNAKNGLIGIQQTSGSIDHQVIYPRDIIKQALLSSAKALVLVHNHPSGIPDPSPEDKAITHNLKNVATLFEIRILDHVILGEEGRYFSFQEHQLM